jgi:hypothetical protein
MGSLASIFGKRKSDQPTDISPFINKAKVVKNDLFDNDVGFRVEATKVLNTLNKFGFSKKTLKLTKNFGIKVKKDLDISDLDYLLLTPFFIQKSIINVNGIIRLVSGNDNIAFHLYKCFFNLYRKGILSILPDDGDVLFTASVALQNYITGGDFVPDTSLMNLKQVIKTVDIIANLYNNFTRFANIGQLEILNILNKHSEYDYCKVLLNVYEESAQETAYYTFLFYIIGHMILNQQQINRASDYIDSFCKFDRDREYIVDDIFLNDNHPLFTKKIFDRAIDEGGKADQNVIELHADFKRKYLSGIVKERKFESVIKHEKINKKNLYFNEDTQKQISELTEMLHKEQFEQIKTRLQTSGVRTGFTILFSGIAGSGKTENSLQIAKSTGRDIIKVDMSNLRSKWWGEDEKNIKSIFSNYKMVLQESRIEPILLLNEADAMIGKRLDVNGQNSAIISSINATQNIILEEMENFEGILIATTNLTQNFDTAFERRFLYKIEFDKPSLENRAKIWIEFLKLNEEDALTLAKKFDFTGAQIENIFRKKTADSILYGDTYDLNKIIDLCKTEKIEKEQKIGFFQ